MRSLTFTSGPIETHAYLYFDPNSEKDRGTGVLIDAPHDSFFLVMQALKEHGVRLTHLLLTHSHWDHIGDASLFKQAFPDLIIGVHQNDQENLENPGSDTLPMYKEIEGVKPNLIFKENDQIGPFKVIETPGHTPGCVCFYDEENSVLFSGDTLFKGTIGNISFATGRPELMWKSLDKLARLPHNVVVYPGHGPATSIGQEAWLPQAKKHFG